MPKRRKSGTSAFPILLGVTAVLLLLSGGVLALIGERAGPAALGGPWTLTRADGRAVSDRDFRGRFLLIYFGYTSCGDVCPVVLSAVEGAVGRLGSKAARLQPLFISVDPRRDTPEVVGRYVGSFGPDLIGLTGTEAQVAYVQREYRVHSAVRHGPQREDLAIDHSSVLFLVAPDGHTLTPLPADATPDELAARLSPYLS